MPSQLFKSHQPTLTSKLVTLRPFKEEDYPYVRDIHNDKNVARTKCHGMFPFEATEAQQFIKKYNDLWTEGRAAMFAIVTNDVDIPIGDIGLELDLKHDTAELCFTLSEEYRGQNFASQAAWRILEFAFFDLSLQCVHAVHFEYDQSAAKIFKKIGMTYEGCLRKRVKKWGKQHDVQSYSFAADDFHSD